MRRRLSPQSGFLLRASAWFAALLVAWWFVLSVPLLAWTRFSTDFLLNAIPGAPLRTGVTAGADGVWAVQVPVNVNGVWRNVRVETGKRLPRQLTICFPLLWAVLLAAPCSRRIWRAWVAGSLSLLAIPPAGLLLYAAHVVQIYVFPGIPAWLRGAVAAADYFATTFAPYVAPVLVAVGLHPELRAAVLGHQVFPPSPVGPIPPTPPVASRR